MFTKIPTYDTKTPRALQQESNISLLCMDNSLCDRGISGNIYLPLIDINLDNVR